MFFFEYERLVIKTGCVRQRPQEEKDEVECVACNSNLFSIDEVICSPTILSAKNEEKEIYEQILIVEKKRYVECSHNEYILSRSRSDSAGRRTGGKSYYGFTGPTLLLLNGELTILDLLRPPHESDGGRGRYMSSACRGSRSPSRSRFAKCFDEQIQVATFVIQRILSDTGGLNFMCITAERFVVTFSCHKILGLPNALLDGTFSTFLFDDHTTRGWLHQLLINLQVKKHDGWIMEVNLIDARGLKKFDFLRFKSKRALLQKDMGSSRHHSSPKDHDRSDKDIHRSSRKMRDMDKDNGREERNGKRRDRDMERERDRVVAERTENERDREKSRDRDGKDIDREKSREREVKDKYRERSRDREVKERVKEKKANIERLKKESGKRAAIERSRIEAGKGAAIDRLKIETMRRAVMGRLKKEKKKGKSENLNAKAYASSSYLLKNGWKDSAGEYVQLCFNCSSIYEAGQFCEMFHSDEDGWRDCESCKQVTAIPCQKPVLTPLFDKLVSTTDSNLRTSRMRIPWKYAMAHFPKVTGTEVVPLNIIDTDGKEWGVYFRCWPHYDKGKYVMTGLKDFYVSKNLQAGDTEKKFKSASLFSVAFYRRDTDGKLVMELRKPSAMSPTH
ncbi:B3 domain-containing protein [Tanacetum coccineum]